MRNYIQVVEVVAEVAQMMMVLYYMIRSMELEEMSGRLRVEPRLPRLVEHQPSWMIHLKMID